jgi:hypothetical protein
VTTEQELKLRVAALDVVDAGALVGAALDERGVDEDPQAAKRMAAGTATTIPRTSGRSLIRTLDPIGGRVQGGAYCMASAADA